MSVAIEIQVTDSATPAIQEQIRKCDPHVVATRVAVPLSQYWRDHLKMLPRNKHGYPSTGFWEQAARSVIGLAVGGSVLLSCDKLGVRQRYYGGPIAAVHHANLTIPITAEAYGTTVADWGRDNLVLVILGDGRKFLALWLGTEGATAVYKHIGVGKKARSSEATTRRAQRFGEAVAGQKKPKVIVFRKGSSAATGARAEKHLNLKFLFKLQESVDQAANPDVVPDFAPLALAAVKEAVS